jgi:hypothetical protein
MQWHICDRDCREKKASEWKIPRSAPVKLGGRYRAGNVSKAPETSRMGDKVLEVPQVPYPDFADIACWDARRTFFSNVC